VLRIGLASLVALLVVPLTVGRATAAGDPDLQSAQAFVAHRCAKGTTPKDARMWQRGWRFNALLGDCGGGDGHDQHIWFFVGGRFVGTDAPGASAAIVGLWRNDETITFLYVLYRPTDALCCATGGGKIVRFRWNGKKVVALDELPSRFAGGSHPVGRYP
jgi:LppP/LprE lipoprotein